MPDAAARWDLLWALTRTEFRLRDQGTALGFLWTLLHPLLHFALLYALFSPWLGAGIEGYAGYLLVGIVQWNFFSTATSAGLTSLRRKAPLLAGYRFPRLLVVLSSVLAVFLSHALEWAVLLGALAAGGVAPGPGWLLLPAVLAVELALAGGVALLLAVPAVHLRDLERLWGILLYGLFFMTPVFYGADALRGAGRALVDLNPLATLLAATRAALLGGPAPAAPALCAVAAGAVALAAVAAWRFPRWSRGVVESL